MAKIWGRGRKGRVKVLATEQREKYSEVVGGLIDIESRKKREENTQKPGIKVTILKIYAEKGKLAAWQALQEYNKGFTLEMLEQWIGEYEKKQAQGVWKDDGYGR